MDTGIGVEAETDIGLEAGRIGETAEIETDGLIGMWR